jgi:hypothetical protein
MHYSSAVDISIVKAGENKKIKKTFANSKKQTNIRNKSNLCNNGDKLTSVGGKTLYIEFFEWMHDTHANLRRKFVVSRACAFVTLT